MSVQNLKFFLRARDPEFWLIDQHIFSRQLLSELKSLFQISSDVYVLFSALNASANHLASLFFLPLYFVWAATMTYILFSVQPIRGYGVQIALFDLILPALAVSPWDLLVQTQKGKWY